MPLTRDTLTRLHTAHAAGVFRFLWTLTRDESAAQDLLHEVFLKLARDGSGLADADSERAWIFTLARHAALDWLRRNRVRERAGDTLRSLTDAIVLPTDPDSAVMHREMASALAALPAEQRAAVQLHLWEGLTFREIAAIQGVTLSTAAGRYRYGIAALRATLHPLYAELHEP